MNESTTTRPVYPSVLVDLAAALRRGEDCAFALHDALLERGCEMSARHLSCYVKGIGAGNGKRHFPNCHILTELLDGVTGESGVAFVLAELRAAFPGRSS